MRYVTRFRDWLWDLIGRHLNADPAGYVYENRDKEWGVPQQSSLSDMGYPRSGTSVRTMPPILTYPTFPQHLPEGAVGLDLYVGKIHRPKGLKGCRWTRDESGEIRKEFVYHPEPKPYATFTPERGWDIR